ncbi:hypothetical protein [Undibacterium macrobrachii]|jgi:Mg/Co/Ni transporter MgtE|uniref:Uncharacterized protein n=1 Tax=Undibacterium macrobrachii TaxID=1119058 RepID=A0ABQ2XCL9_9BURK|nr:hypothetical protein [Undibacterium macrobrachii]GGX10429.1 hypothetical protein GCM10011282_15910 [Undibacterium macrobrachii]
MAQQNITLSLSLANGNLILEALAERPFKQVFELIGELNQQASRLFSPTAQGHELAVFTLSPNQLRLILEVLGEMPYNRVHRLLQNMHQQLQEATTGV